MQDREKIKWEPVSKLNERERATESLRRKVGHSEWLTRSLLQPRRLMEYVSTRQSSSEPRVSFEEAVINGLAPDGGLYVPASVPNLPQHWQTQWAGLNFQQLALEIYSLFIPTSVIPRSDLERLIHQSYSTFRHPDIAPLVSLSSRQSVLELFHGPTFAFKDVALQFLGNLFEFFLTRKNASKQQGEQRERLTVVGATSGDTGRFVVASRASKAMC